MIKEVSIFALGTGVLALLITPMLGDESPAPVKTEPVQKAAPVKEKAKVEDEDDGWYDDDEDDDAEEEFVFGEPMTGGDFNFDDGDDDYDDKEEKTAEVKPASKVKSPKSSANAVRTSPVPEDLSPNK